MEKTMSPSGTQFLPKSNSIKTILPITPFLVINDSGSAEVVFVGPDGTVIGKPKEFNEDFAEIMKSAIIRAKIANAGGSELIGGSK